VSEIAFGPSTPRPFGTGTQFPTQLLTDPALNGLYQAGRYIPLNQNQFGANLGGPIKKDKLFFFANWESFRAADSLPVFDRVPDINSRAQATCPFLGGCSSSVQSLLNLFPMPNVPASTALNAFGYPLSNPVSGDTNIGDPCYIAYLSPCSGSFFTGNAANRTFSDNYLGRIDFNVSPKTSLSFKYNFQTFNQLQAGDLPQTSTYPGSGITLDGQNQNFSVNYVHVINSSTVNKLTFGWNRFSLNTLPLDHTINASQYFHNLNFSNEGLPSILIGGSDFTYGAYSDLGATFNAPYTRTDSVWSIYDSFSKIVGSHTLDFGGEYRYNRLDVDNQSAARGLETFFSIPYALANGFADFASIARVGPQFGGVNGVGSFARTFSDNAIGLYAADTWRIRPNMSLYYGLRWDVYQAPVEASNRLVNDYPGACTDPNGTQLVCLIRAGSNQIYNSDGMLLGAASFTASRAGFGTDWHNFGPHIGISWSPGDSGTTVFRGGFAVAYQQQSLEPSVDMLLNPPFIQQSASLGVMLPRGPDAGNYPLTPGATFAPGFLTGATPYNGALWWPQPYSITARDPNTRTPYVYQYHFGVEQQLGNYSVVGVSYVGSQGRRLPADVLLLGCTSTIFNGPNPSSCLPPLGGALPQSQFSDSVVYQENRANSSFNSLQVLLRTRSYHGLSVQAFYQWSHAIDDAYSGSSAPVFLFSPTAGSIVSNEVVVNRDQLAAVNNINPALTLNPGLPIIATPDTLPNNTENSTSLAAERGNSDFDIRNLFVVAYTYDLPPWKTLRAFGSGWELAGITTIHSGQPYSVYGDFFGVPLRPTATGAVPTNNTNSAGAIDGALPAGCNVSITCAGTSAVSAFDTNATFDFNGGSLGRNTFYGPKYANFDFSVLKNTKITEGTNLQFRAEFFNLFNNTNFRQPNSQSGQYVTDPTTGVSNVVLSPFFGQILQAYSARQIQFGLKFQF